MALVYFILGFTSAVFGFAAFALKSDREKAPKKRTWEKINSAKWSWNFDYDLKSELTAQDVVRLIAMSALNKSLDAKSLQDITVRPGFYSVRMFMEANFVKREELPRG